MAEEVQEKGGAQLSLANARDLSLANARDLPTGAALNSRSENPALARLFTSEVDGNVWPGCRDTALKGSD